MTTLDKKLRAAGRRHSSNLLLDRLSLVLLFAGLAAMAAALVHRLLGVEIFVPTALSAMGSALLAGIVWWYLVRPSRAAVAVLVDERLGLKERVSTALAFSDSNDPFAQAASRQAQVAAEKLDVARHFPVRPTRRWAYASLAWTAAVALVLLLPSIDALGFLKQRDKATKDKQEVAVAKADVKDAVKPIEAVVRQIGDPSLTQPMEKLNEIPPAASAEEIRRDAIQKLEDLSNKVKELQDKKDLNSVTATQEKMQQLKAPANSASPELNRALQKGDFAKAAQALSEMQKKLDEGKMDAKEKQALKDQLADLSKQLDKLSKEDKQLEDELAQKGLDKSLAQKDIKDLREELKKQGLSDKQIDEMIQKAKESKGACKACKSLSDALKTPGLPSPVGLNSKDLSQSEDQLTEMEAKQLQLQQAQAAQQQCKGAMDKIGQCQGGECTSPGGDGDKPGQGNKPGGDQIGSYKPGESDKQGSGSGGPGRGNGARPTGPDGDTKTNQTKVSNP